MDPLSITASVITIFGAAKQTYKALRSIYNLKNAPQGVFELMDEVSELQALLYLVQKATRITSLSSVPSEDQELIKRLVESAKDPLNQLDSLITVCLRNADADAAESGDRSRVSFTTWLRSRKSVERVKNDFSRAHRNINTALVALGNIQRQEDSRLILNIHELILDHTKESKAQKSTREDELAMYRQFTRVVVERMDDMVSRSDSAIISYRKSSAAAQFDKLDPSLCVKSGETRLRLVDQEEKLFDDHSGIQDPIETSARIRASISKGTCAWNCHCQCHPRKAGESPRWLSELLGTLFYSYTGFLFLCLRPCNYSACIRRESSSCQLTYHFPRWLIKRAFVFTASYRNLCGNAGLWSTNFPRTISASHRAWHFIERDKSHHFLQLLRERAIFGNDMADDDGTSLLLYALKFRSHNIIQLLLNFGASPHLVDPRGVSVCAYAQSYLLIDRPSERPSWVARMDLVTDDPSITDDLCLTPLHHLVIGLEQADLRQELRLKMTNINVFDSFGRSPLHWAAIMGNSTAIEALLEYGANANSVDKEQMTPLHNLYLAPVSSQARCGQLLLDAGAKVDALDFWGRTPIRIAVGYPSISLDFLGVLLEKGADVNRKDIYAQSPLLKSIQGRKPTTQLLLSHGADTEARDEFGNTPILESIYRNKPSQLLMLLKHGATTNGYFELKPGRRARDGQVHLLDFMVWYGTVETMQILEESVERHYHLTRPLDSLEQYRDFRLASGRKIGTEECEAFGRMLSKFEFSSETCLRADMPEDEADDDEKDNADEIFTDAHDYFLGEEIQSA